MANLDLQLDENSREILIADGVIQSRDGSEILRLPLCSKREIIEAMAELTDGCLAPYHQEQLTKAAGGNEPPGYAEDFQRLQNLLGSSNGDLGKYGEIRRQFLHLVDHLVRTYSPEPVPASSRLMHLIRGLTEAVRRSLLSRPGMSLTGVSHVSTPPLSRDGRRGAHPEHASL